MADVAILETRERVLAGILLTGAAYFLFSAQDASIKLLVMSPILRPHWAAFAAHARGPQSAVPLAQAYWQLVTLHV